MKKYISGQFFLTLAFFLLYSSAANALSFGASEDKSLTCRCLGHYGRVNFEVVNGSLNNVQIVTSSSDEACDSFLVSQLNKVSTNHPNGTEGVAVTGYSAKNKGVTYEQCMESEGIELDNYWFVEDVVIDIEKVNEKN